MIQPSTISILVLLLLSILGYATFLEMNEGQDTKEKGFCGVIDRDIYNPVCGNMIVIKGEKSTITVAAGKSLFKANCSSCHARDMKTKLTGPALSGVGDKWSKYPREDLYDFIRNSEKMVQDKHPRAIELWEEWGTVMTSFPNLTDDQVESLLLYIN